MEQELGEQAALLASITRELAQCCMSKDAEIFDRFRLSPSEGHVLLTVADGETSPSALAEQLGVVRSRITPLIKSLVDRGFVQRSESREDRRMHRLKLTREGEQVAQEATQFRLSFHARLLGSYAETERARLLETLAELHHKMTELRQGLSDERRD